MARPLVNVQSLARVHTEMCIRTLAQIATTEESPHASRVAAIGMLLDRGWGRPTTVLATEDGAPLTVVIRQIIERIDEPALKLVEPVVRTIDHEPGEGGTENVP